MPDGSFTIPGPPPAIDALLEERRAWCDVAAIAYFECGIPDDVRPTHLWEIEFRGASFEEYEHFLRDWYASLKK